MHVTAVTAVRYAAARRTSCSGLIVSTGTGSTAWVYNAARVWPDDVERIMREIGGSEHSEKTVAWVSQRVNSRLEFDSDSPYMSYLVREPIDYSQVESASPAAKSKRHGWARSIKIRSLGYDCFITFDGVNQYKLGPGTEAQMEVAESCALRTVIFDDDKQSEQLVRLAG